MRGWEGFNSSCVERHREKTTKVRREAEIEKIINEIEKVSFE